MRADGSGFCDTNPNILVNMRGTLTDWTRLNIERNDVELPSGAGYTVLFILTEQREIDSELNLTQISCHLQPEAILSLRGRSSSHY